MAGYYEAVRAYPAGESTAARLALTASEFGFSGLVVRNAPETGLADAGEADGPGRHELAAVYDVDVVDAVEIDDENPSAASARVKDSRNERTLVVIRGSRALNRFACEEPRVDVLSRPMASGDVNHVLARAAKRNGVRIEFDFGRVLRASGGKRVKALADLRKLREIVFQYDTPYVVSAGAENHLELRAPRELLALGGVLGFTREQVSAGLAEWGRLTARNRERLSESFIEPGVKEGRYEKDD